MLRTNSTAIGPHSFDLLEQQAGNDENLQQNAFASLFGSHLDDETPYELHTELVVRITIHFEDDSTLLLSGVCKDLDSSNYELLYEFSGIRSTDPGFQPPQEFFGGMRIHDSYDVYLTEFLSVYFLDRLTSEFLAVNDVYGITDANSLPEFFSIIILHAKAGENSRIDVGDNENNSDHENNAANDETGSDDGNDGTEGVDEDNNGDHGNGSDNGAGDSITDLKIQL
ncbi:unnamed protein product [Gongylonema pulchrum]|uniref:CUB domain-containing protein n=1 Tax=Gongylonema pulchrum TaxID=637853 RepID=A0A183E2V0_9BILA|nr:unnamed protein product [Gongylonema pulchrum]